jgi:hypothetical protein
LNISSLLRVAITDILVFTMFTNFVPKATEDSKNIYLYITLDEFCPAQLYS